MTARLKLTIAALVLILSMTWIGYILLGGDGHPVSRVTPAQTFAAEAKAAIEGDSRFWYVDFEFTEDPNTLVVVGFLPDAAAREQLERALDGIEGAESIAFDWSRVQFGSP